MKEQIIKVLNVCKEAVLNNDWNIETIRAINACARQVKNKAFISKANSTKYVLLANIQGISKAVGTV